MNITVCTVNIVDRRDGMLCDWKLFLRVKDAERWMEENRIEYGRDDFSMYLGTEPLWIGRVK